MGTDVSGRVREIAQYRETDKPTIIQRAVEAGIDTLWRDVVISKYVDGEISRREGCDELGADVINQVDQAKSATDEDIEWGMDELNA